MKAILSFLVNPVVPQVGIHVLGVDNTNTLHASAVYLDSSLDVPLVDICSINPLLIHLP